MNIYRWVSIFSVIFLLVAIGPALAMDKEQKARFRQIQNMNMSKLTQAAEALLEKKYPDTDWDEYEFPTFVYTSDAVEIGYRIAVKESALLGDPEISVKSKVIPCFCFCDAMGHKNLLHCFLKGGQESRGYDDHAAGCNICYGEAMLAFLWTDLSATHIEIMRGLENRYSRLIEMREERGY
ncbi:MAG: PCYCGC domain-containing protein [Geopsychrobacter sp.]|nr:PCYCGC domain-containing protein [Geopsychrobacter sp.]